MPGSGADRTRTFFVDSFTISWRFNVFVSLADLGDHSSVTNLSPQIIENSPEVWIRPDLHIHKNIGKKQPITTSFSFPWSAVSQEY